MKNFAQVTVSGTIRSSVEVLSEFNNPSLKKRLANESAHSARVKVVDASYKTTLAGAVKGK